MYIGGGVQAERNFGVYATFISFFPQLVAGPIERTSNLLPQITSDKKFDYDLAIYGARQILWGFFKKIAVADVLSIYVDYAYNNLNLCTQIDLCLAVLYFAFQIYCDFSGYSDIAIGTAKLFGIRLMNNFASPYCAHSIKEFWSRWHISLSTWFRDYVYIPLGGNRCSKGRNRLNLFVTFLASGLWHGANWTFVIWGGIHGLAQIVEKALGLDKPKRTKASKIVSWAGTFLFCSFAWVFFRAASISDAVFVFRHLIVGFGSLSGYFHTNMGPDLLVFFYTLVVMAAVSLFDLYALKHDVLTELGNKNIVLRLIVEYTVLVVTWMVLWNSSAANPFVYFQF